MSNRNIHSDKYQAGSSEWRFEKFAELRNGNPDADHEEIVNHLYDLMAEAQEAEDGLRMIAEIEG